MSVVGGTKSIKGPKKNVAPPLNGKTSGPGKKTNFFFLANLENPFEIPPPQIFVIIIIVVVVVVVVVVYASAPCLSFSFALFRSLSLSLHLTHTLLVLFESRARVFTLWVAAEAAAVACSGGRSVACAGRALELSPRV